MWGQRSKFWNRRFTYGRLQQVILGKATAAASLLLRRIWGTLFRLFP